MALISILMPVYNAEIYLKACLTSIQNQEFKNFEVLIIDDGSTDNSGEICDYFAEKDKRFHVRHQKNQGSGKARNDAIEWAMQTDSVCIVWVDSDDVIHPKYLEILYSTLQAHPECDMIQCKYTSIEKDFGSRIEETCECGEILNNEKLLTEMVGQSRGMDFTLLWNKIYRKSLYQNSRVKINQTFTGRMQDDVNILSHIYKQSIGCGIIDVVLYFYRIVENSIQHKKIDSRSLEYFYIYKDLYLDCINTELNEFANYLSERMLFDLAWKLRYRRNQYADYKKFYSDVKKLYQLLNSQIDFKCIRKDLKILKSLAQKCFYSFRIYAVLYNFRGRMKTLLK